MIWYRSKESKVNTQKRFDVNYYFHWSVDWRSDFRKSQLLKAEAVTPAIAAPLYLLHSQKGCAHFTLIFTEMRPCITIAVFFLLISYHLVNGGVQLLSKSKLEKCEKVSENAPLNCTKKIVINLAVPSEAVSVPVGDSICVVRLSGRLMLDFCFPLF